MAAISTNFGDLLDPRFQEIVTEEIEQLPDLRDTFYRMVDPKRTGQLNQSTFSEVSGFDDIPAFTGALVYDDPAQGYDKTLTHVEYARGFSIERKLFDDAQHEIMEGRPRGLAAAYARTRQKHAAQPFNNAFSVDTTWLSNSEGVALCSNAHTTTKGGVSTATGFDNLGTAALSAVAIQTQRLQMRAFRGLAGERLSVRPSMLLVPPDLEETGYEIIKSSGKVDTANNNRNINEGRYRMVDWDYLDDADNWFLIDEPLMKRFGLVWIDRVAREFAQLEDFETLIAKFRLYSRYSLGPIDWHFLSGNQVS